MTYLDKKVEYINTLRNIENALLEKEKDIDDKIRNKDPESEKYLQQSKAYRDAILAIEHLVVF